MRLKFYFIFTVKKSKFTQKSKPHSFLCKCECKIMKRILFYFVFKRFSIFTDAMILICIAVTRWRPQICCSGSYCVSQHLNIIYCHSNPLTLVCIAVNKWRQSGEK